MNAGTPLSLEEQSLLADLNARTLLPFKVTVEFDGKRPEHISLVATDSCMAVVQMMQILFPDFDSEKPKTGMSIKVTPINSGMWRPA